VIYAGDEKQVRSNGITVLPLNEMERLLASSS
jgi:hypothetical protein